MTVARSKIGEAAAVLSTAVLLLVGCNSKRLDSLEARTARIEEQLAVMERTQARLVGLVDSLGTLVEQQTREFRERRAGGEQRLSELERVLHSVQAELEVSQNEIRDLKDRLRFEAAPAGQGGAGGSGGGGGGGGTSPRALYDAAYQDLTRGNRELALAGFQELLSRYPDSELADNAQYWIAEAYYSQRDYERALEEFRKVQRDYSAGDKVADALLKIGFCFQNMGREREARSAFQDVIDRFPSSEPARLAKHKLSEP